MGLSNHVTSLNHTYISTYILQSVAECVRMKGPWMKKPVHVLVQMATVGTTVKVSTITYVALILFG